MNAYQNWITTPSPKEGRLIFTTHVSFSPPFSFWQLLFIHETFVFDYPDSGAQGPCQGYPVRGIGYKCLLVIGQLPLFTNRNTHASRHAHTHTHTRANTHMHTHTCPYTHAHAYTRSRTRTHVHPRALVRKHTRPHTHRYTHAHKHTSKYTHKHTRTHTHPHTHTRAAHQIFIVETGENGGDVGYSPVSSWSGSQCCYSSDPLPHGVRWLLDRRSEAAGRAWEAALQRYCTTHISVDCCWLTAFV